MIVREDSITGKDDATISVAMSMYRERKKTLEERQKTANMYTGIVAVLLALFCVSAMVSPRTAEVGEKPDLAQLVVFSTIIILLIGYLMLRYAERDYEHWQDDRFAWCEDVVKEYAVYMFRNKPYARNELVCMGKRAYDYRAGLDAESKHRLYVALARLFICGWGFMVIALTVIRYMANDFSIDGLDIVLSMIACLVYISIAYVIIGAILYYRIRDYRKSDYDMAVNLYLESQNQ